MIDVVITCGDINGIGPEIALKSINTFAENSDLRFILAAPGNLKNNYTALSNFKVINDNSAVDDSGRFYLFDIGNYEIQIGKPSIDSGRAAYRALMSAIQFTAERKSSAVLVTSPLSKFAIKLAGIDMPGHTEILADHFKVENYCMIFLSETWHAALATIHIPVNAVPGNISTGKLVDTLKVVLNSCRFDLNIKEPKIAVLGLNPHAGEEGNIGREEIDIINPAVKILGKTCYGSFVPDAYFAQKQYLKYDVTFGMYHDQVLIPFKLLNGESGVNFTAGLPIVRTSPDHGTAFDIAGKNIANPASMKKAIAWALKIIESRNRNAD